MDPFAAIGLAGTIVQFVDFGSKIILEGRELFKSGSLKLNEQAEVVAKDLLDFSTKLQRVPPDPNAAPGPPTENELALRKLCEECNDIAKQILAKLDELKPKLRPPKDLPKNASRKEKEMWFKKVKEYQKDIERLGNSLRLALLSVWSRKDLLEIGERLEKYRAAIQTRILGSLV
jgi:hypothetical protein